MKTPIIIALLVTLVGATLHETSANENIASYERQERLSACYAVYRANETYVDNTYIHTSQDVVKRCATMMGLIGAYESGFYKSRRCVEDNNCFGIKSWYTGRFMKWDTRYEGKLYFATKYLVGNQTTFRGHKNRNINQFVENWSGDDRATELRYISFVTANYWNLYNSY